MAEKVEGKYLIYKNRPLVREGNTICYGDMTDKCILILEIMSYKEENGKTHIECSNTCDGHYYVDDFTKYCTKRCPDKFKYLYYDDVCVDTC